MCRRFDPGPDHFDFLNVFPGWTPPGVPSSLDERHRKFQVCTEKPQYERQKQALLSWFDPSPKLPL